MKYFSQIEIVAVIKLTNCEINVQQPNFLNNYYKYLTNTIYLMSQTPATSNKYPTDRGVAGRPPAPRHRAHAAGPLHAVNSQY